MTELELFLMKVPGLSELEAKELIGLLDGLDDFSRKRLEELKLSLVGRTCLEKFEMEEVINLLLEMQENK